MQIRYVNCVVVRDPMMKVPRQIPAWELPMLKQVYGEGNVEDIETFVTDAPQPLSPEDELSRMIKAYGREKRGDGSAGEAWAHIAYGRGADGINRLDGLMRDAIVDVPAKASKKAASKPADTEGGE